MLLFALGAPAFVRAQDAAPAVLVVRAEDALRARAEAVAQRIADGALGDGRDVARPPVPMRDGPVRDGWLARTLIEAEDHYARFALDDAAAVLEDARARLDADGTVGATHDELVELFLLRARVAQARGDAEAATVAAREALAIAPALVVDAARHPPTLAALVDDLRSEVGACPVAVERVPAESLVSIDGAPPGPVPATLGCGAHWLWISAPAYVGRGLVLELGDEPARTRVALELDPGAALALAADARTATSPLAAEAAAALGRELLVLELRAEDGGVVVSLGERRVHAAAGATVDELVALLAAAGRPAGGLETGVVVGVGVAAALAIAVAVTVAVVVATAPAPTAFELRGVFLP